MPNITDHFETRRHMGRPDEKDENSNGYYDKNSRIWVSEAELKKSELEEISQHLGFCLSQALKSSNQTYFRKIQKLCVHGNDYMRWELTGLELNNENSTIPCFIFGKCYDACLRYQIGSFFYFIDPKIEADKSPENIIYIGKAQDFVICKARRFDSSNVCQKVVNR
ncbi:hypothetical protein RF11_00137 [Thelohanellus kitauei]|uniref:Uncharacterized protein n=1 Tax=Thelohanellus kitauei TaxID=669202 RepID=A0A0C2N1V6_THEKT|nr:hypothetical protein RF11_00137 [Thelohanellus kitauei]